MILHIFKNHIEFNTKLYSSYTVTGFFFLNQDNSFSTSNAISLESYQFLQPNFSLFQIVRVLSHNIRLSGSRFPLLMTYCDSE